MKKWIQLSIVVIACLFGGSSAFAQGGFAQGIAWRYTPAGAFPAGGATITVCTSGATGTPCTPTVSVYADVGLSIPVTNPLPQCTVSPQTGCIDNLGNFTFYASPGVYTHTVTGNGLSPYGPIPITAPGGGVTYVTGCSTTGGVSYQNGTNNTLTCDGNFSWVSGSESLTLKNPSASSALTILNPTAATVSVPQNSPIINIVGTYWTGSASAQDIFSIQSLIGSGANPATDLTFSHTGSSPAGGVFNFLGPVNISGTLGVGTGGETVGGPICFQGGSSGTACVQAANVAGSPCILLWPTLSAAAGQSLTAAAPSGGNCQASWAYSPIAASLTTTAATTDNVTVTGMTASGHCSLTPTNSTASGLAAIPYISNKTTNQITVTHSVTALATFDILCTPY